MTDKILRELAQLQRYATSLTELMKEIYAEAPSQENGTDRTGTIQVNVGPDGLPKSIRVQQGWKHRLEPTRVGEAVVEGFQAAIARRMTAWTGRLHDSGWLAKVERLQSQDDEPVDSSFSGEIPPALRNAMDEVRPRPLGNLAEDMIKAFDEIGRTTTPLPVTTGTGSAASGKVALTLSASGLVSCVVAADWAAHSTATMLTNALGEALAGARSALAFSVEPSAPASALDRLLVETLAVLRDPQRMAEY